jgi:hypothetical protein
MLGKYRARMKFWSIIIGSFLVVAGLSGCTGLLSLFSPVPAAGIKYLKSLPHGAFQDAAPRNVRVAINLPAGVVIKKPVMEVSGEKQAAGAAQPAQVNARVALHEVPRSDASPATLTGGSGKWTYYALTPQSRSEFRKLQAFVPRMGPKGTNKNAPKMTLTINLHNQARLTNCKRKGSAPMKVAILLDPKRGYVIVWDHSVSLSKLAAAKDRLCPSRAG